MRENSFAPGERRFLAACAVVVACALGLALWHTVPLRAAQSAPSSVQQPLRESFLVDLNTAGVRELCTLPGIGEQKAAAIVEYRRVHGTFASVEAVAAVPGITQEMTQTWQGVAYVS